MKKLLCLLSLVATICATSCTKEEDNLPTQEVKFVTNFSYSQEPMKNGTGIENTSMTDLLVVENNSIIGHQVSTSSDFGSVTLNLTQGTHYLTFITFNASSYNLASGYLTLTSMKDCFAVKDTITVTSSTTTEQITLNRTVANLSVRITDNIVSNITDIRISLCPYNNQMSLSDFCYPSSSSRISSFIVQNSWLGHNYTTFGDLSIVTFEASQTAINYSDVTVTAVKTDGTAYSSKTLHSVPMQVNYKTIVSGNLFSSDDSWNIVIDTTYAGTNIVSM